MSDLTTEYLGLELRSPLVVSSNPLSRELNNVRRMEAAGAGAVVLPSLFEEQITLDASAAQRDSVVLPPALRHLPELTGYNRGADGYLMQIYETRQAVDMPVIASLNGSSSGGWVSFARLLASAGADAIELNAYYLPTGLDTPGTEVEERVVHLVRDVKAAVAVPVAVKLNPYYSSLPHFAARLVEAGADGLVLFNRFYQPDIDVETESVAPHLDLSDSRELRLRLRWVALLHGRIAADLAVTGGVHTGHDAAKAILAGATVAMMASALLRDGIGSVETARRGLEDWLDRRGYASVGEARGRLSAANTAAAAAVERANYIGELQSWRH
jgi:dihydroorotate dehydrogenase (fumarate)